MIKTTLGSLIGAQNTKVLAKLEEIVPPGSYQFSCSRLLDAVQHEITLGLKQQNKLIKVYGIADSQQAGGYHIPAENMEKFSEEMEALMNTEIEIQKDPIVWEKLGEEAHKKLTIGDVRSLGGLLTE